VLLAKPICADYHGLAQRLTSFGDIVGTATQEGSRRAVLFYLIVSVNPAFTPLTRYILDEVIGQNPDAIMHARRHSDEFYPRLESSPHGQWQGEIWFRRKDGEVFPAWESVGLVHDTEGEVTHYVIAFSDITAIHRSEEQLHHLAHHDPLTGLPNRLLFNDRLDQLLSHAHRSQTRCAILFIDLDGFKSINDTLGHSSGDLLLQNLAARIRKAVRRGDTAARLGGDEFVVVLSEVTRGGDAARIARKLLDLIAAPLELAGERIAVSASIGVAMFPEDGSDRLTLIKAADTAMYHAKAQGRNRFSFCTEELAARVAEHMRIEQGIRRGLETQAFVIHYQPVVSSIEHPAEEPYEY
jgi:diguanylate cyclase (GGDEF)-like protein/PAS domain S-box-containing protein